MVKFIKVIFFLLLNFLISIPIFPQVPAYKSLNVMAPLSIIFQNASGELVVDQVITESLELQILELKKAGLDGVFFDFWINQAFGADGCVSFQNGEIDIDENKVDWRILDYYVALAKKYEIKLSMSLSFHQLGGNVGDGENFIPIGENLKETLREMVQYKLENSDKQVDTDLLIFLGGKVKVTDLFTKGLYKVHPEPNNNNSYTDINYHYFSPWITQYIQGYYSEIMSAVARKIERDPNAKSTITPSPALGSAGEAKVFSYVDGHNPNEGSFPGPGIYQHLSDRGNGGVPLFSFISYLKKVYSEDYKALYEAWGLEAFNGRSFDPILDNFNTIKFPRKVDLLHQESIDLSNYGIDYFSWLHHSLLDHVEIMLISFGSYFKNTKGVVKIPGIFWNRVAEAKAGILNLRYLLETADINQRKEIFYSMKNIVKEYEGLVVLAKRYGFNVSYTSAELPDGFEGRESSRAQEILKGIVNLCNKLKVTLEIENALAESIQYTDRRDVSAPLIINNLKSSAEVATLLRVGVFEKNEKALRDFQKIKIESNLPYIEYLLNVQNNQNFQKQELFGVLFDKDFLKLMLDYLEGFKNIDDKYLELDQLTSKAFTYLYSINKFNENFSFETVINDKKLAEKYKIKAIDLIDRFASITMNRINQTKGDVNKILANKRGLPKPGKFGVKESFPLHEPNKKPKGFDDIRRTQEVRRPAL